MANCSTCDGKLGFLTKTKIKDGTLCMHCFVASSKALEKYGYSDFASTCKLFSTQECKDIIAEKDNVLDIIERINNQAEKLEEKQSLNRKCLICGKEFDSIIDGYVTQDGRRICTICSYASYTLYEGKRQNRPGVKALIADEDSEFFLQGMTNFKWVNELAVNYERKTIYTWNGTYRFDQMIKIENDQETYEVRVGKKGHPIIRAVVGNAMFGTAGAVVGAVTANDTRHFQTKKGKRILIIYFQEDDGNVVKYENKCNSDEEFVALEDAVMKIFKDGEEENNNNELIDIVKQAVKETNISSQSANLSVADEIKKYKELLDIGAITQEEFDAKKKQLLSL